jgi:hypothetical protein
MRQDIEMGVVKDVAIAIVPEKNTSNEREWLVYFLNMKDKPLESVIINAEGRGMVNGHEKHTATMRFFLEKVEAGTSKKIEMILPEAFALNNQYWVSFYEGDKIFDKKFIFAANTINEDRMVIIPLLNKSGIMVK